MPCVDVAGSTGIQGGTRDQDIVTLAILVSDKHDIRKASCAEDIDDRI